MTMNRKPVKGEPIQWLANPEVRAKASETRKVTPKTGHKVTMKCDECGEFFEEYKSRRNGAAKLCSIDCRQIFEARSPKFRGL